VTDKYNEDETAEGEGDKGRVWYLFGSRGENILAGEYTCSRACVLHSIERNYVKRRSVYE